MFVSSENKIAEWSLWKDKETWPTSFGWTSAGNEKSIKFARTIYVLGMNNAVTKLIDFQ